MPRCKWDELRGRSFVNCAKAPLCEAALSDQRAYSVSFRIFISLVSLTGETNGSSDNGGKKKGWRRPSVSRSAACFSSLSAVHSTQRKKRIRRRLKSVRSLARSRAPLR
eukprot:scaffold33211_cov33-Tisochrysis_lutea.AAC.2